MRHDDPHAQAALDSWTDAEIRKVEHVDTCRSGCTDLMMRCFIGMQVAEEERSAWRRYFEMRRPSGVLA